MPSAKFTITKKCKFCNKNYIAKVITSVYCSPNCSKAGYRKKKRLEKLEKRKLEIAKKVPENQEYIDANYDFIYTNEEKAQPIQKSVWFELKAYEEDTDFYEYCIPYRKNKSIISIIWED